LIVAEALLAGEQPGVSRLAVSKRRRLSEDRWPGKIQASNLRNLRNLRMSFLFAEAT